jgi:hypothetical protein
MSRAANLFERIRTGKCTFLQNLLTEKTQENDYLEFKGASKLPESGMKELWSQALSGFANTEGGVVVLGIRAARNKTTGIEEADSQDFVPDVDSFAQKLRDVELQACVDPVPGVQIERFRVSGSSGFIACLIPEGSHKPYRADLHPDKHYFQRIGDKFQRIPHSLLRSLFYPPTPRPKFRLTIEQTASDVTESGGGAESLYGNRIKFEIENVGIASARELWIEVKSDCHMIGHGGILFNAIRLTSYHYCLRSAQTLHPSEKRHCGGGLVEYPASKAPQRITLHVTVYALDCSPVGEQLVLADLAKDFAVVTDFSSKVLAAASASVGLGAASS